MKKSLHLLRTAAAVLAVSAIAPMAASAQDLPPAQEIIDRYVEAIGGREAALRQIATRTTGTFSMPAMGVTGELEVVTGENDEMATRVVIPGMGEMMSGYTGEVAWSMDPMMGARLLEGMEFEAMKEQAEPLYGVRDASLFTSFETVGEAEYDGDACWEIAYVWVSGRETTECYSKDTGFVIAQTSTQESPMGEVESTTRFSNYQRFGDLMVPTQMRQSAMGQEQVMTIDNVELGSEVDTALLAPPAAILTLINAGG